MEFNFVAEGNLPLVRRDHFFIEYPDDVSGVPLWMHYNTVVGYVLSGCRGITEPVAIQCEDPVPRHLADFWRFYQDTPSVTVSPLMDMAPLPATRTQPRDPTYALLYGGGKDSLFTLSLIARWAPPERIKLISFSMSPDSKMVDTIAQRRDKFALSRAGERFGVEVLRIKTDALTAFDDLHTDLYTAAILPLAARFDILTYSYEYAHYFASRRDDGTIEFSFRRSRPEMSALLSQVYSHALGWDFRLLNANHFVSELSSLKFLVSEHADELPPLLMMCESTFSSSTKWCGRCTKCATFVLYSLYLGLEQTELPADEFLASGAWIGKVLARADALQRGLWFPELTARFHFDSLRLVLAGLKPRRLGLGEEATKHLRMLKKAYGHRADPREAAFYGDILDATWPPEDASRIRQILAGVLAEADAPRAKEIGNQTAAYDQAMALPLIA